MVVLQRQNIRDPFNSIKTGVILMKSFDNYYHAESISFSDKNILILVLVVKRNRGSSPCCSLGGGESGPRLASVSSI